MPPQRKVIITCAVTGSIHTPSMSPYLPITPEQVAEGIRAYAEAAGPDLHFVAQLYWPGMPYERQREAMRVFAERVAPLLRS